MTEANLTDRLLARARRVLEVGSEAADVLVHLQGRPSAVGIAAVGMRVINSVREHRSVSPEEYFAAWQQLHLGPMLHEALVASRLDHEARVKNVPSVPESMPALQIDLGDQTYAWSVAGSIKDPKARPEKCWIPPGAAPDVALQRLGRSIWVNLGTMQGVLEPSHGSQLGIVSDDQDEIFESKRATDLYERVSRFLTSGIHRSVFMVGDPGIGKSAMMRYVARRVGGLQLRVRLSRIGGVQPQQLTRAVQLLRPNVLVIDDLDRYVMGNGEYGKGSRYEAFNATPQSAAMLDPLEVFSRIVPLVMASANFSNTITGALLRPGRFDEMLVIDKLDDELYARLLPDAPASVIQSMTRANVPAATVQEIRKRVEVMGIDAALQEVNELLERSNRILVLNERKMKKKRAKRKTDRFSLVGKTPLQRASILERRARMQEGRAEKLSKRIARLERDADRDREKAERERQKAQRKVAAKKKPSKKTAKKSSRKKKASS